MLVLLKIYFYFAPLTPEFHAKVEPIINGWVDKINELRSKKRNIICKNNGHKMPPNDVNLTDIFCGSCERCGELRAWYRKTGKELK